MRATALLAIVVLSAACSSGGAAPADDARSTECAHCHLQEYHAARDHEGKRPTTCGVCHSRRDAWKPSVVDHSFWPITGAHTKAECSYCHKGEPPVYHGNPKECVDCHREDFDGAKHHQRTNTACKECHGTEAWKPTLPGVDAGWPPPQDDEEQDDGGAGTESTPPPGAGDAGDAGVGAEGDAAAAKPKPPPPPRPRPKPKPKPDVTTGGSRRG